MISETFFPPVYSIRTITCCFLLATSLSACAMSQSPEVTQKEAVSIEDASTGMHGKQFEDRDPEADARDAIKKDDLRLLGLASRVTSVPGITTAIKKSAVDSCGVRLIKGFGDVIRSEAELSALRLASSYAKRYNAVMIKACLNKD